MNRKILAWTAGIVVALTAFSFVAAYALLKAKVPGDGNGGIQIIYIDRDDTPDSVRTKSCMGWRWDAYSSLLRYRLHTGRYAVTPGMTFFELFRALRSGSQKPVRLVVPTARTIDRLASILSRHLMMDSLEVMAALTDSTYCAHRGYTKATIPALFIPDTYEVYWDISVDGLMERMVHENARFWTAERKAKAEACGLNREEVATLASIVDEETANDAEKPMIAGLYLNRLRLGMPLQADPTVKFAIGDFSLRRIMLHHLQTENPYNTYKVVGLPPGPIRIASKAGLDAVLNHKEHSYLYMCAKEDFSGSHNFAVTLQEHYRNARRYTKALNARGIH